MRRSFVGLYGLGWILGATQLAAQTPRPSVPAATSSVQGFSGGAGVMYLAFVADDDDGGLSYWVPEARATWLRKRLLLPDLAVGLVTDGGGASLVSVDLAGGYRFGGNSVTGFVETGPTLLFGSGGGGAGVFVGAGAYIRLANRLALRLDLSPRIYSGAGPVALGIGAAITSFPKRPQVR